MSGKIQLQRVRVFFAQRLGARGKVLVNCPIAVRHLLEQLRGFLEMLIDLSTVLGLSLARVCQLPRE